MNTPLFIRFLNNELFSEDLLAIFARSTDSHTAQIAMKAQDNPPNLDRFKKELKEAVTDIISEGLAEEFAAFANNYMEPSLVEDVESSNTALGDNISRVARIRDENSPWVEGLICYNLCLYIKAYGLDSLKKCRVCSKIFNHKGKYAVYCSDACKASSKKMISKQPPKNIDYGPKKI
jgi:hypothetical protein